MALIPRFQRTSHLVDLVGESERLAAVLAGLDRPEPGPWWERAALATLRLDGSTITAVPSEEALAAARGAVTVDAGPVRATWADTLRSARDVDDLADEHLWAREYAGVMAALQADDLADRLASAPVDTLAELHRRLTVGLVAEPDAGRPRRTEQAVHDASVGRILYYTVPPEQVPGELHRLAGWLASAAAREHGLVVSGVAHLELLRIHPFEAANGRLARAAARLLLRSRALDPHGLSVPEIPLAEDPIGVHDEVARTLRRRDLTIWLERWGEAVVGGMRLTARAHGALHPDVPERAERFVAGRTATAFTVADYRADVGVGPEDARNDLSTLLDAGLVVRRLGSRGLRFDLATEPRSG